MLILIAHGSPNPRWRDSVETLTQSLQATLGPDKVQLAYMQYTPPTLPDVAFQAAAMGIKKIRALPLFLTTEGHVDRHIRPLVDKLRKDLAPIEVELLPPLGQHPLLRELLCKIALQSSE
ncbi:MAG: CbiX/SirB N-terminal domain-containing protein [Phycisphaerales bacterium]|nr:MAG: CbiX/SirB N-terminal domain-containing protein [Phycisphaerales bacterium]